MEFPLQQSGSAQNRRTFKPGQFDMRDWLSPRRLTIVMWDQAFLMRHAQGESFESYQRILDETIERGYNTVRIDPLPQLLDLSRPETVFRWNGPHLPYMPWGWNKAGEGPLGRWLVEFMEQVQQKQLNYTLSSWWFTSEAFEHSFPQKAVAPHTFPEAAELWAKMLREWKKRLVTVKK